MYHRQHSNNQNSSKSAHTPPTNQFAPSKFVVQTRQEVREPISAEEYEKIKASNGNYHDSSIVTHRPTPKPPTLQLKLKIGQVGDKYEQEADQVAQEVVQRIHTPDASSVQTKEQQEEEETPVNAKKASLSVPSEIASENLETSIQRAKGGGQPLANSIRQPMEKAFGKDFSSVKVHTDARSDQMNQSIQAKAFTTGQDIFFRGGEYNPGSKDGQELIAHELTHVVQQTGAAHKNIQAKNLDNYFDSTNPAHDPAQLSDQQIRETREYQYLEERFSRNPEDRDNNYSTEEILFACRLALRYIQQNQVCITLDKLETFLPKARRQLNVANEASAMVGQNMTWVPSGPGSRNTFEAWASAESEQEAPPISELTTINCWEMILLAAYRAGMVTWQWIHDIYTAHTEDWGGYLVNMLSGSSRVTYRMNDPNTPRPLAGDIVFFDGAAHVALGNGVKDGNMRSQIISFWPPPDTPFVRGGTLDRVKVTTIEELVDFMASTPSLGTPVVEFASAPW